MRITTKYVTIGISSVLLATGLVCVLFPRSGPSEAEPPRLDYDPASPEMLDDKIAKSGKVALLSHDGKWIGTDGDFGLQLFPNRQVTATRYGIGVETDKGTFNVAADGTFTMNLGGSTRFWPTLVLRRSGNDFMLIPKGPIPYGAWPMREVLRSPGE